MKKLLLFSLLALLALGVRSQSADKPGNWKLIASDEYPAEDVGVATYTVTTDFNADPTGVKNSLDAFQTALTKLGENRRGGVLFVPAFRKVVHSYRCYDAWRMETAGERQASGRNHPDGGYAKWI